MLFDFHSFIEDLRQKPEKKKVVEKYEEVYGPIKGSIQDQLWFTDYVSKFRTYPFSVPEELEGDFDWGLLLQLVAASFSSEGVLEGGTDQEKKELIISVKSGDQFVVKKVNDLWSFQVLRLYEIYIEEQMNLQRLMDEEKLAKNDEEKEAAKKERAAISQQRDAALNRWKLVMDNLNKAQEEQADNEEKEEKLGDLYSQL